MFSAQPTNLNNTKNKEATAKYPDLYKIEKFLAVLRDDYIWTASVDIYISGQDLCGNIGQLKQSWINNGKYMTESPNDSFLSSQDFHKYLQTMHQPGTPYYVTFYLQHWF